MPRAKQTEIRMRLVVENPVPGVAYSLQDKASKPVDAKISKGPALKFDFTVRIAPKEGGGGPKFHGEQMRIEGPERRIVYIGIGQGAGQRNTPWSRRMKIDIHAIPQAILDKAAKGKTLEAVVDGTGKDGSPACATVVPVKPWRAV